MPPKFPTPLTTERLLLRAPCAEDAEEVYNAILESFDQLHLWMPWAVEEPTLAGSLDFCTRSAAQHEAAENFALLGFGRDSGRLLLATGCHPINLSVPSYFIGYWCRMSEQRKGYVSEAVLAVTRATFEAMGARRIEIRCEVANVASRAVAEKCGFRLEGELRNDCRNNLGSLASTYVFSQTRED